MRDEIFVLISEINKIDKKIIIDYDDNFEDRSFFLEAIKGQHQFAFECRGMQRFGYSYYYDDGEDNVGSYIFTYYSEFSHALTDFIRCISSYIRKDSTDKDL